MAKLSEQTLLSILSLQRQLIQAIDAVTALESFLRQGYGTTDAAQCDLEQLQTIRHKLTVPYLRLCTLLLRVAEFQPIAPIALLNQMLEVGQAAVDAAQASVQEISRDWSR